MKSIQNIAAIIFIIAVVILSAVSIFGVWDFFSRDVITKSFQTLGWLVLVSIIVMVASQFIEKQPKPSGEEIIDIPNPMFKTIRRVTLSMLIVSVSLIALLGVLTIWEIIHDKQVLYKSFSSLAILAFMAFIIVKLLGLLNMFD